VVAVLDELVKMRRSLTIRATGLPWAFAAHRQLAGQQ